MSHDCKGRASNDVLLLTETVNGLEAPPPALSQEDACADRGLSRVNWAVIIILLGCCAFYSALTAAFFGGIINFVFAITAIAASGAASTLGALILLAGTFRRFAKDISQ